MASQNHRDKISHAIIKMLLIHADLYWLTQKQSKAIQNSYKNGCSIFFIFLFDSRQASVHLKDQFLLYAL